MSAPTVLPGRTPLAGTIVRRRRRVPSATGPRVLVVDDEAPIRQLLRRGLEAQGYQVVEAGRRRDRHRAVRRADPDLVILDLGLPDRDGRELIAEVRLLEPRADRRALGPRAASEKVAALDLGGSDYVVKPFHMSELLARVRALLRDRPRAREDAPVHRVGELELDVARRRVLVRGAPVRLSRKEFELLRVLVMHAGRVVTHKQLLERDLGARARERRAVSARLRRAAAREARRRSEPTALHRQRAGRRLPLHRDRGG